MPAAQTIKIAIDADVFHPEYLPHLGNMARTQIYYGGAGSGKSVFLAQRCVYDMLAGGRNYLVCRAVGKYVKKSVWTEVLKVISDWELTHLFTPRIVDGIIDCVNGYQIIFTGLDDPEKLKSIVPAKGAITDVWVEEATETDKRDITNLRKRQRGGDDSTPKRITLSFNPILKTHWIYKEFFTGWADDQTAFDGDDLTILKTWHIHNSFLTTGDRADLEGEQDEYFYQVYTLGNWGVVGRVIFKNWRIEDLSQMESQFTNPRHGLDFGFSNDPAAAVLTHYDRKRSTIYIYRELYELGLTNDMLAAALRPLIGTQGVVADSAEPKSIVELQGHRVNAYGAKKGKDSINHGVQWLQQQTIILDKSCVNAHNEFLTYQWKEGRDGEPVSPPRPVDKFNHIIDALRYAYEDDMVSGTSLFAW